MMIAPVGAAQLHDNPPPLLRRPDTGVINKRSLGVGDSLYAYILEHTREPEVRARVRVGEDPR